MVEQLQIPSLLIALPALQDQNFARSVILMVEHNADGALGYIVNRPLPVNLRDHEFQQRYQIPPHIPIWLGGPLGVHKGVVIQQQTEALLGQGKKEGPPRVSSSEEAIEDLLDFLEKDDLAKNPRGARGIPYRFVIGYAGWGPRQLEGELKAGAWIHKPLDLDLLFHTPWQEMWQRSIEDLGIHPMNFAPTTQTYLN